MKETICAIIITAMASVANAQEFRNEVSSIDSIIEGLYKSISGEVDEPRNWALFNYLFSENARLIPTGKNENGNAMFRSWTPVEYQERSNNILLSKGFHEVEINRVTETYGPVTHVFSTYESRYSKNDEQPFSRGINSIQLFNNGQRWWIMTIYWASETDENPIPAEYLP